MFVSLQGTLFKFISIPKLPDPWTLAIFFKPLILEIFDKAQDQAVSRTSIAEKVAESLDVSCNRKLVRKVLDEQRSSKLEKLKKIS